MRELKFRAWDNVTLKMSPPFALFGEFTLLGAVHDWQHEMGHTAKTSLEALGSLEVMQFTGLHDKNGKEIFEGDLIKSLNITMYGGVREIQWHDQICAWVGTQKLVKPILVKPILLYDFVNPEVIGNIYEHPNLMKQ